MAAMATGARWLNSQASVMPSFLGWTAHGACCACSVVRPVVRSGSGAQSGDTRAGRMISRVGPWGLVSGCLSIPDAHDRGPAGVERTCHSGYGLATSEAL